MGYIKTSSMPKDLVFGIKAIATDFDATGYYKPNRRLHMCNGQDGTIDLRDRFLYGASATGAPGSTGGALSHNHSVSGNTDVSMDELYECERRPHIRSNEEAADALYEEFTIGHVHGVTLNTSNTSNLPPWYRIFFVQVVD